MAVSKIHILGLGSIGTFTAHVLAEAQPSPVVTLLLHRPDYLNDYVQNGNCISLHTNEAEVSRKSGYDFEVLRRGKWYHAAVTSGSRYTKISNPPVFVSRRQATDTIRHLVVAVKNWQTVSALAPLKDRLGPQSTILFIRNGLGMVEAVNKELFPDSKIRPKYVMGITTQCINLVHPFDIEHAAFGKTSLGRLSCTDDIHRAEQSQGQVEVGDQSSNCYLVDMLISVPRMNAKSYSFTDILQLQLEKLAINAVKNPICALADAKNEYLWQVPDLRHDLLEEISAVVRNLPELKTVHGVAERFSTANLEDIVEQNLRKTAAGTCSMVWDLRAGRKTEVRFINGYWVRRGQELGVPTPVNAELVSRIEEREQACYQ